MPRPIQAREPAVGPRRGIVHSLALALVWLAIFTSGFVAFEPAPTDALMIGLIVLLPVIGLTAIRGPHLVMLCTWLVITAGGLVAVAFAVHPVAATVHTVITLYLAVASFVIAAFVARDPEAHVRLILRAAVAAAVMASLLGVIGYFDLIPGAKGLFTRHGRAAGLFKDPNVFAPFLVPPLIYLLHESLARPLYRSVWLVIGAGIIALAMLLSFSRGGWLNLIVALAIYGYFAFLTARTDRTRLKLVLLTAGGLAMGLLLVVAALQFDQVSRLFGERVALSHSYDEGPEGRFGGQIKAIGVLLENPLGIGALQFGDILHPEHPHNVFISMFLNAGWLGGVLFLGLVIATLVLGVRAVFARVWPSPLLLVVLAALAGVIVEGLVVETDHWRVFHLLMGLMWGLVFPSAALRLDASRSDTERVLARIASQAPRRRARIIGPALALRSDIVVCRPRTRGRRQPKRKPRLVVQH